MPDSSFTWSWITLILLGSFHGLNPAMGWLFAVALGFQERRTSAVARALAPIALGHAISIAAVAAPVWVLGAVVPQEALMVAGGAGMLGFAAWKVVTRFRHRRWVGMRVTSRDLVAWSVFMATAHGAGLMLVPPLVAFRSSEVPSAFAQAHHLPVADAGTGAEGLSVSLLAVGLHTVALLLVAGATALLVYKRVGVDILRSAWVNLDLIWIGALAVAGAVTVGVGAWTSMA